MPTATPIVNSIGAPDIAQLRALGAPRYQEVIRVYWGATMRNYANTSINNLTGFSGSTAVFGTIYPRILKDKWVEFKMSSLLDDDSITLELTDPDEAIKALARASGEGQMVELYSYYPDVTASNPNGLAVLRWWGLMKRPDDSERYTFRAKVAAGFRSPNLTLPKRFQHPGCQATFGGLVNPATGLRYMTTLTQRAANACPYNIDLVGGTIGVPGFTSCPRDSTAACEARLGSDYYRYYLGFPAMGAFTQIRGKNFSFIARSEGNPTLVRKRLPLVYGIARLNDLEPIATQNQISPIPRYEERGYLNTLYNICEGPTKSLDTVLTGSAYGFQYGLYYFAVNNKLVPAQHHYKFPGEKGSAFINEVRRLGYQLTAQVVANLNYGEFSARYPSEAKASVTVDGISNMRVYTTTVAYTETYSTVRAWGILDILTNKRYGLGYDISLFYIQDWLNLAAWHAQSITMLQENGTSASEPRSTLNAAITERPAAQIINDLCASGRTSLPFFFQGKIRIVGLGLETLTSLLTFTDETTHSETAFLPNIRKDSLKWTVKGDEEIVNQVKVTYDEWLINGGDLHPYEVYERSIVLDDQHAQLRAGVTLGDQTTRVVDASFQAFGVKDFAEAGRLTTLLLDLGEHEQGGIENNLTVTFETTGHNADAFQLHQYRLIKILNVALNAYTEPDGTPFDTFRVKELRRKSDGWLTVVCQGYAKSYMADTEDGNYVEPLAWAVTESNYGRIIARDRRVSAPRTMPDGRTVKQPRVSSVGRTIDAGRAIILPSTGTEQVETATVVGAIVVGGNATVVVTAAGMTGSPKTVSVPVEGGITQRESGLVVGSIDTAGNAGCRVTAAGMTGSPITLTVAVALNDSAIEVASKIRTAMAANANITALFAVTRIGAKPILTRLVPAANDATLNIETGNGSVFGIGGSCAGLTTEAVSENTRAGTASGDDASAVATKIRAALTADVDIFAWLDITGTGASIIATRKAAAADDATLNISIANGTCTGLTNDATSDNTRAGVAP